MTTRRLALAALILVGSSIAAPSGAGHDIPATDESRAVSQFEEPVSGNHGQLRSVPHVPVWDNGRAGTSSQTDTVSCGARLASPKAGVVVRGGLGHAETDYTGAFLGASRSGRAMPGVAVDARASRIWPRALSGPSVEGPPTRMDPRSRTYPAGSGRLSHLRQPTLHRPAASVLRDPRREHAGRGSERTSISQPQLGRTESQCQTDRNSGATDPGSGLGWGQPTGVGSAVRSVPSDDHQDRQSAQVAEGGVGRRQPALITEPADGPYQSDIGSAPAALWSATATWCKPTSTQCQGWGGDARLAAVYGFRYGDEPYWVRVWRGDAHVDVRVVSHCGCDGSYSAIDLSAAAFAVLAPLSRGRIAVAIEDWRDFVEQPLPATDKEER